MGQDFWVSETHAVWIDDKGGGASLSTPILNFVPKISEEVPVEQRQLFTLLFQKLGNHTQAMGILAKKSGTTTTSTTIVEGGSGGSSGGGGGGGTTATIGAVNDQSGSTSYATAAGDYGALIVLSDASAISVILTTQAQPWCCFFANQGTGTATINPGAGTISYAGNPSATSMPLLGGYCCFVAFDGTNWWAWTEPIVPVSFGAVTHEFLTAYNAANGAFSAAQPAIADVSGLTAALALLAPLASPALTGTPTAPTASPSTDDTQIATTAYADAAVLVETNRAEAAEGLLAPKASPTFTGTVTQPDAPVLTAATVAATATAGAGTLPSGPQQFLAININGSSYKIPLYLP